MQGGDVSPVPPLAVPSPRAPSPWAGHVQEGCHPSVGGTDREAALYTTCLPSYRLETQQ